MTFDQELEFLKETLAVRSDSMAYFAVCNAWDVLQGMKNPIIPPSRAYKIIAQMLRHVSEQEELTNLECMRVLQLVKLAEFLSKFCRIGEIVLAPFAPLIRLFGGR